MASGAKIQGEVAAELRGKILWPMVVRSVGEGALQGPVPCRVVDVSAVSYCVWPCCPQVGRWWRPKAMK